VTTSLLAAIWLCAPQEIPEVAREDVICFALYTVHHRVLKLTAQLYPLKEGDDRTVRLEIRDGDGWREVARTRVIEQGWTAPLRVEPWDDTREVAYRVRHGERAAYEGLIRRNPVDRDVFIVAAFTGNSVGRPHGGDLPRTDIVENLKRLNPDLLFFSGDQVYDHHRHYAMWLRFGRDFGPILRRTPTVTIPDDHDVGQSNLWGAGGKKSNVEAGHDGGYFKPVAYVNEVQRAQTSHLPDPFDPTPIERGITVYYTALTWGRISFAILEDRKWKSGPEGLVPSRGPRPDHIREPNFDPKSVDVPGAELLGPRQLAFVRQWAADWRGADMKCVLSQTVFCGGAHLHGRHDTRLDADLDANGWPQTGRARALHEFRRGFAFMLGGDQHLGTLIRHGIDDWNDAGWSFCVPSIANLYLRWWSPQTPGRNREPWMPEHLGEHLDGLGNKVTMFAVANPSPEENQDKLTTRAAGFGIVKFNRKTREITAECWPRNVDVTGPPDRQYPGWPRTIPMEDNYGRSPAGFLPTLDVRGMADPVVQVVEASTGEVVYTLRIRGTSFRPKVFARGAYTVRVGEPGTDRLKILTGIEAGGLDDARKLTVEF
jgi:hypothetical protein